MNPPLEDRWNSFQPIVKLDRMKEEWRRDNGGFISLRILYTVLYSRAQEAGNIQIRIQQVLDQTLFIKSRTLGTLRILYKLDWDEAKAGE